VLFLLNFYVSFGLLSAVKRGGLGLEAMAFIATFNNNSVTSWQSFLLVEETGVPQENH
jgi:hypothetical protein